MFSAAASGNNLVAGFFVGAATSAASSYLRIGSAVADAVISGIGEIYEQKANNPTGKINWRGVASSAVIGGLSSFVGAKTVSKLATAIGTSRVAKAVVTTVTTTFTTTAAITYTAFKTSLRRSRKSSKSTNSSKSVSSRQVKRNQRAATIRNNYRMRTV